MVKELQTDDGTEIEFWVTFWNCHRFGNWCVESGHLKQRGSNAEVESSLKTLALRAGADHAFVVSLLTTSPQRQASLRVGSSLGRDYMQRGGASEIGPGNTILLQPIVGTCLFNHGACLLYYFDRGFGIGPGNHQDHPGSHPTHPQNSSSNRAFTLGAFTLATVAGSIGPALPL